MPCIQPQSATAHAPNHAEFAASGLPAAPGHGLNGVHRRTRISIRVDPPICAIRGSAMPNRT